MKKILIFIALTIIMSAMVAAQGFEVTVNPIDDVITLDQSAEFKVILQNEGEASDFRVYYNGVEWDIKPMSFSLEKSSTKSFIISPRPLYVNTGQHAVTLNIKNQQSNVVKRVPLIINVQEKDISSYIPSIGVQIYMPDEIQPNNDVDINLTVRNKNPLNLGEVKVNIDSDYFSSTENITLGATTSNNVSFVDLEHNYEIPDTTKPQTVLVTFTIIHENQTIYLHQKSFDIVQYSPNFNADENINSSFFKTVETHTIRNPGNVQKTETYKIKIPLFKDLFSFEQPAAGVLKESGDRYLFWEVTLNPGDEKQLVITRNYRPLMLSIVIALIIVVLYFLLRSPLKIRKSAQIIMRDEGGISMLKIMLKIKNISGKSLRDVKIYDTIPNLADYVREETPGSLSPSKVLQHENRGSLLKFEVPEIEAYEERIITYKIKAQLRILGGLKLPIAESKFKTGTGRPRSAKSNQYRLVAGDEQ